VASLVVEALVLSWLQRESCLEFDLLAGFRMVLILFCASVWYILPQMSMLAVVNLNFSRLSHQQLLTEIGVLNFRHFDFPEGDHHRGLVCLGDHAGLSLHFVSRSACRFCSEQSRDLLPSIGDQIEASDVGLKVRVGWLFEYAVSVGIW
jgi:hypothetical protein